MKKKLLDYFGMFFNFDFWVYVSDVFASFVIRFILFSIVFYFGGSLFSAIFTVFLSIVASEQFIYLGYLEDNNIELYGKR